MRKKKVIIVDDEKDFLMMLKMTLEEVAGYEILALSGAEDIVSKVNGFKPDIILLDMIMPRIGGIEACEMIKDDPDAKEIPIIMLTALSAESDRAKAYDKGAVDYITKPVKSKDLVAKIEKALKGK